MNELRDRYELMLEKIFDLTGRGGPLAVVVEDEGGDPVDRQLLYATRFRINDARRLIAAMLN